MRVSQLGVRPLLVAAIAGLFLVPATTLAVPMAFLHASTGGGTLDGQPFAPTSVVVTGLGDTDNRQSDDDVFSIDYDSASIAITGLGTFDILTPTRTFVNNGGGIVGFSRAGLAGNDLIDGPFDSAFDTWDMTTPIGPITGPGGFLQWGFEPQIFTSGGLLLFDSAEAPVTFTALPEPAALALVAVLAFVSRRRA